MNEQERLYRENKENEAKHYLVENAIDIAGKKSIKIVDGKNELREEQKNENRKEDVYKIVSQNGELLENTLTLRDEENGEEIELNTKDDTGVTGIWIDSSRNKKIVETQINGTIGSIKEWISDGDENITLTIQVVGKNGEFPKEKMIDIVDFLSKNKELKVMNEYLNNIMRVTRRCI